MCNFKERLPTEKETHNLTTGYKVFRVNSTTGEIKSMYNEYLFPSDGSWKETLVSAEEAKPQFKESVANPPQTGFHVIIKEVNARKFFEYAKREEDWLLRKEYGKFHFELRKVEVAGLIAIGKISPCTNGNHIYMGDRRSMLRCRKLRILEVIDSYSIPKIEVT